MSMFIEGLPLFEPLSLLVLVLESLVSTGRKNFSKPTFDFGDISHGKMNIFIFWIVDPSGKLLFDAFAESTMGWIEKVQMESKPKIIFFRPQK